MATNVLLLASNIRLEDGPERMDDSHPGVIVVVTPEVT